MLSLIEKDKYITLKQKYNDLLELYNDMTEKFNLMDMSYKTLQKKYDETDKLLTEKLIYIEYQNSLYKRRMDQNYIKFRSIYTGLPKEEIERMLYEKRARLKEKKQKAITTIDNNNAS